MLASFKVRELPEIKGVILSASPGRSFAEFNFEQMGYLLEWGQGLSGESLQRELASVMRSGELINQSEAFCKEFPFDCEKTNGKTFIQGNNLDTPK